MTKTTELYYKVKNLVLDLKSEGLSNRKIASKLDITEKTVRNILKGENK